MEYEIKKIIEEMDLLSVTQEEYNEINRFYREILSKRQPRLLESGQVYDVRRIILTDGLSRVEVAISVKDKEPTTV